MAHGADSRQWVTDTLTPVLKAFNVEVLTIDDMSAGVNRMSAHMDLIKEACKVIVVVSEQSAKDKLFLYDISLAQYKDPDPSKISIIPILFGNVTHSDLPTSIMHLLPISYDNPDFVAKIKQSFELY